MYQLVAFLPKSFDAPVPCTPFTYPFLYHLLPDFISLFSFPGLSFLDLSFQRGEGCKDITHLGWILTLSGLINVTLYNGLHLITRDHWYLYLYYHHHTLISSLSSNRRHLISVLSSFLQCPGLPLGLQSVMVTLNIHTDLDIANGVCGIIEGIVLDKQEHQIGLNEHSVYLHYFPHYVLVQTKAAQLPGLDKNVISISPVTKTFMIMKDGSQITVHRTQLLLNLAFSFC
jgi:hypothetical protein